MKQVCSDLLPNGGKRVTRSHMCSSSKSIEEKDGNIAKYMENSSIDHHVPANAGGNAYSPSQVGASSQYVGRKSAQDSVKGRSLVMPRGNLAKKDMRLNRFVFTKNGLQDGTELHYVVKGQKELLGFKMGSGIYCEHCWDVVSASKFEEHAGYGSRRKPFENICTTNGKSLHTIAIEISEAKLEEQNANTIVDGRIHVFDPVNEINRQGGIRVAETSMSDIGGCAIFSGRDFTEKGFDDRTIVICDQCELEYHNDCSRVQMLSDVKALPKDKWFCCEQCKLINSKLQMYTKMGNLSIGDDLYNVVKKIDNEQVLKLNYKLDIKWRVLNGRGVTEANKMFLSDVVSIFQDQFGPIANSATAFDDIIPHMVYGNSFKGKDYGGMHCAILMVNSIVVSAAIFRVFGEEVAELSLVATKRDCQRKGYFQLLFYNIVALLVYLNVRNLVLPSADDVESFWINRFGFNKLDEEKVQDLKKWNQHIMVVEGTSILHKSITKL